MALSRNFRTTYYKTLGVPVVQHIVDVEASFAALLNERTINVPQLLKLALELGIAPQFRARCWLLFSGVLPPYSGVWDFALQERRIMFEDVVGAAQVLQAKNVEDSGEENEGTGGVTTRGYYDFLELLMHLHRTYWIEIAVNGAPLLCGMDDARFLRGVARVVCEVLTEESERFWCFTRLLELFHEGLELVDPMVPLDTLYDIQVADFEVVFLRTLDVKRRRFTADTPMSNLHMLKNTTCSHDEEYGRRR
ncbi:hypothetical protein BBO99_00003168 [Phytophthora kernoviae]|uniref:Rab-GAP TBC domain-containing protein n=2 Tax=Phytophthora kernoviae TaxID=325452 RepID=A0A3R7K143_9STRA|nr:hypothetical protein G195_002609 [Phytophthora kernoviae 00238/432]KAG2532391.1 hypothetical protein JM16_000342 [Phytophthora kernoviae]KAG2533448.1 hypothetical protein JM18_000258 [Phytophthora kernoviae]RLN05729.1 hypothetical protein BBI17_003283 [Phytophthora kernoviae]RLN82073.1 hypothetical protein BBO99_00003168 [Phytophthora kernoviae]